MHPLMSEAADRFWDAALTAATQDARVVLGFDGEALQEP